MVHPFDNGVNSHNPFQEANAVASETSAIWSNPPSIQPQHTQQHTQQQHIQPLRRSKKARKRHVPVGPAGVWFQVVSGKQQCNDDDDDNNTSLTTSNNNNNNNHHTPFYSAAWMAMQVDLHISTPSFPTHYTIAQKVQATRLPDPYMRVADVAGSWRLDRALLVLVQDIFVHDNVWTVGLQDETGLSITAWMHASFTADPNNILHYLQVGFVWQLQDATISYTPEPLLLVQKNNIAQRWTPADADALSDAAYIEWMERRNAIQLSTVDTEPPEEPPEEVYDSDDHEEHEFDTVALKLSSDPPQTAIVAPPKPAISPVNKRNSTNRQQPPTNNPYTTTQPTRQPNTTQPETSQPITRKTTEQTTSQPNPYTRKTTQQPPSTSQPNTRNSTEQSPLTSQQITRKTTEPPTSQPNPYTRKTPEQPTPTSQPNTDFSQFALSPKTKQSSQPRTAPPEPEGTTVDKKVSQLVRSPVPRTPRKENTTPNTATTTSSSTRRRKRTSPQTPSALWMTECDPVDWELSDDDEVPTKGDNRMQSPSRNEPSNLFSLENVEDIEELFGE